MKAIAVNFPESEFPYSQLIDQTAEACVIASEAAAIAAEALPPDPRFCWRACATMTNGLNSWNWK